MDDVRSRGLVIHPWELRNEPIFVSPQFNGNATLEAMYFICCLEVEGKCCYCYCVFIKITVN